MTNPLDPNKVYGLISEVALREELELRSVGTGIFSMQEEAFVYIVGKEIAKKAEVLFPTGIRWYTEKQIEKSPKTTITDLVFEDNEGKPVLAMEFKTRRIENDCLGDIKKLRNISVDCQKIFCALVEENSNKSITWFVKEKDVIPLDKLNKGDFDYFSTMDYHTDSGKSFRQTCCIVAAWEVMREES
tara:strand:- start:88 stop:648 length:561 start_codon:yes stop_codon:yes gene_type:complete